MLIESTSVRSVSSLRSVYAPLRGGRVVPSAPICPIQDGIFSAVINAAVYGRIIVITQLPSKLLRKLINRECDHAILQACGVIIRLTSRTDRSMTRAWKFGVDRTSTSHIFVHATVWSEKYRCEDVIRASANHHRIILPFYVRYVYVLSPVRDYRLTSSSQIGRRMSACADKAGIMPTDRDTQPSQSRATSHRFAPSYSSDVRFWG